MQSAMMLECKLHNYSRKSYNTGTTHKDYRQLLVLYANNTTQR